MNSDISSTNIDDDAFFEEAALALHAVDESGVIVRANARELELLGYEREEYVGRPVADFHVDAHVVADILARLRAGETLRDVPARLRAKDGSTVHVLIDSNVRRGPAGEFVHTRCFTRDVTDQVRAEQALREFTEGLERTVAERTQELERANAELERHREQLMEAQRLGQLGSWELDLRTGEVDWSAEIFRILGLDPGVSPRHELFLELLHPDDRALRDAALEAGLRSEEPFSYEARVVRRDGAMRTLAIRARATLAADGTPLRILGTAQDVSDARAAEEQRRALEARWQEAERLKSLGLLAGGIAHDFNNLLVGVLGNATLALAELPPASKACGYVRDIELAGRRAAELTQQLLAYTGQGSFVIETIDVDAVVAEMRSLLESAIPKKVRLRWTSEGGQPAIEGDATQLRQVLMNLIVNAADAYGDGGGEVRLRTRTVAADAATLASFAFTEPAAPGAYVLIEVADDGCGMDEHMCARIYDPFFSTKPAGQGHGLGLAGVRGIVTALGGAIRVESVPGAGSTFSLLLPAAGRPVPSIPVAGTGSGAPGTILLADDEPVVRDVATAILEEAGFRVVCAEDGDEALARFAELEHEVDAVVLDLMMPGRGGGEVLAELRSFRPGLPVVISSGYTEAALEGGAVGEISFLQKPYTSAQLVAAVRDALEGAAAPALLTGTSRPGR